MKIDKSRLNSLIMESNLDCIIATSPENISYTTGHTDFGPVVTRSIDFYSIIVKKEDLKTILIVPVGNLPKLLRGECVADQVVAHGSFYLYKGEKDSFSDLEKELDSIELDIEKYTDQIDAFRSLIKKYDLNKGKIGIDAKYLSKDKYRQLKELFNNAELVNASNLFYRSRIIKSEIELNYLRQCSQVNEKALQSAISIMGKGVTEIDLWKKYKSTVIDMDAFPMFWEGASGTGSSMGLPLRNEIIRRGDLVRFDCGCVYNNYWSDTGRVAIYGEPTKEHMRIFNSIKIGVDSILEKLKDGADTRELFKFAVENIRKSGIKDYARHHCGHSIGLEFYEEPMIVSHDNTIVTDNKLRTNMLINIETPYYKMGFGGFQLEDTVLVKENGYEFFTTLPRALIIV